MAKTAKKNAENLAGGESYTPPPVCIKPKRLTAKLKKRFELQLVLNRGQFNKTCRDMEMSPSLLFYERKRDPGFNSKILAAIEQGREMDDFAIAEKRSELEKTTLDKVIELVQSGDVEFKGQDIVKLILGDGRNANSVNVSQTTNNVNLQPVKVEFEISDPREKVTNLKRQIDAGEIIDLKKLKDDNDRTP